jgi:hypothetical protein
MTQPKAKKIIVITIFAVISAMLFPRLALADGIEIPNPIKCNDLLCVLLGVMKLFLGAVAVFGTFMFMYGGFMMLISGGNAETVKKGKDTLVWSAIGIAVVLLSWAAVVFITNVVVNSSF